MNYTHSLPLGLSQLQHCLHVYLMILWFFGVPIPRFLGICHKCGFSILKVYFLCFICYQRWRKKMERCLEWHVSFVSCLFVMRQRNISKHRPLFTSWMKYVLYLSWSRFCTQILQLTLLFDHMFLFHISIEHRIGLFYKLCINKNH